MTPAPTRRAAVLGSPIAHSRSPVLHRAAYAALGLDWRYDALDVTAEQLPEFLNSLGPEWVGLSLTMPLKQAVLPLLDSVTETVRRVGAANTVVLRDGVRHGDNTDVAGMVTAIRRAVNGAGRSVTGASATVLGSGATARSAIAALADLGVARVSVVARRPEATAELVMLAETLGMYAQGRPWTADALGAPVVISTVPAGVTDPFADKIPPSPGVLLDVVYAPWPTRLAAAWASAGGAVAGGFDLLLWQAVDQVALMTGLQAPVAVMSAALAGN